MKIPSNGSALAHRKPVVLCLDDDPETLGSLRRLLRREPYELVTTANPGEALERLHDSFVEVVISDELMPWMSGTSFLRIVEKQSPATARVIVSGHRHVADFVKQQGSLVHHFIPKPWNDDELRTLLRGLVAGPGRRPTPTRVRVPEPRPAPTAFMVERPVLLECAGLDPDRGASMLRSVIRRTQQEGRDLVVVLESLDRLAGDPMGLLAELVTSLDSSGNRIHLLDRTGIVKEFFQSADVFNPRLKPYGPTGEPARTLLLVDPVPARRVFLKLLFGALGHTCFAVSGPEEARPMMDVEVPDRVLMELSDAGDPEIRFIRDLSRTSRGTEVVPLLAMERVWSPTIARKWHLVQPLVRPYSFVDLHDVAK
jgi:CheY-like chemotaxis protein